MPAATQSSLINSHSDRVRLTTRSRVLLTSLGRTLRLWRSRLKERHAFPVLDERDLRDMRLSRWDVERELAKPFWRG